MEIIFYLFLIAIIISIPVTLHYFKKPNHSASIKDLYAEGLDMLLMGKRKNVPKNVFDLYAAQGLRVDWLLPREAT